PRSLWSSGSWGGAWRIILASRAPRLALVALGPRRLSLESGQDGLDERVLDAPDEGRPGFGLRAVDRSRDVHHRRDFLARTVLEDLGRDVDGLFFHLLAERAVFVLVLAVDLQVAEERLHVTVDAVIVDAQLRVHREHPRYHVELRVGTQQVVHLPHVGVLELRVQREIGALVLR